MARMLSNDMAFHHLWEIIHLRNQNQDNDDNSDTPSIDSSDDQNARDTASLFRNSHRRKRRTKKKTDSKKSDGDGENERSIGNNSGNFRHEWTALFVGVFFVAGVAGIGTYQAFNSSHSHLNNVAITSPFHIYRMPILPTVTRKDNKQIYNQDSLPGDLTPTGYLLYEHPNVEKQLYNGLVKINITCLRQTKTIVLHFSTARNNVTRTKLVDIAGKTVKTKEPYYNTEKEYLIIELDKNEMFKGDRFNLYVGFAGTLGDSYTDGVYLTEYTNGNGKKEKMVSTFFEPTSARRAFPCFDEPAYKAPFEVIVQHRQDDKSIAVSNMPVTNQVEFGENGKESYFEATPPMSSYLLAYAVTQYHSMQTQIDGGVKVSVFAPEGRLDETKLALSMAPLALSYFSEKFNTNFTLPKLDLLPVKRFGALADENWGIIVFLEDALLFKRGSVYEQELVTQVVNHEIAHQWFGNLVTMKSWGDLWLKESFAALLQNFPIRYFFPSWDIEATSYMQTQLSALCADSSKYTHPVVAQARLSGDQLKRSYDSITYNKGAAVLSMCIDVMGEDKFFSAVQSFTNQYQLSNANYTDFIAALNQSDVSTDMSAFTSSWLLNTGFPLVSSQITANGTLLELSQARFQKKGGSLDDDTIWPVFVSINFYNETDLIESKVHFLNTKQASISVPNGTVFYKLNARGKGFYRSMYSPQNLQLLNKQFLNNHQIFSPVDRANILSGVFELTRFGHLNMDTALKFTEYLERERHPVVWTLVLRSLLFLDDLFRGDAESHCLKGYIMSKVEPVLNDLNSRANHTHLESKLISSLVQVAAKYDFRPLTMELNNIFLKWIISSEREIPAGIRRSVFYTGIRLGNDKEWTILFDRYKQGVTSRSQANLYLSSLASSKDPALLERLLSHTFNESIVKKEDRVILLSALCSNYKSQMLTQRFIQKNAAQLNNDTQEFDRLFSRCFNNGKTFSDSENVKEVIGVLDFDNTYEIGSNILEAIEQNIAIVNNKNDVSKWLANVQPSCSLSQSK